MNSKITFKKESEDGQEITISCNGDLAVWEVLEEFRYFLLAAGYHPNVVDQLKVGE